MRALLLTLAFTLLVGCPGGPGGNPDTLLERRGFPDGSSSAGLSPPPDCEAPECWSAEAPDWQIDFAADGAGGVNRLAWYGTGWDIEHPGGTTSVTAPAALMHYDTTGVLDRWEGFDPYTAPKGMSATGDGGLLLVVVGETEVLGETLVGAGSVLKLDADWQVEWQLHVPSGGAAPLLEAFGAPDGGGFILVRNNKQILDANDGELLGLHGGNANEMNGLLRVDADGQAMWTQRMHEVGTMSVAPDGSLAIVLAPSFGSDQPLWNGDPLPTDNPQGSTPWSWVVRTDPVGAIQWVTGIYGFVGLNPNGHRVVATSDGGAWSVAGFYRPFGSNAADLRLWWGEHETELPQTGVYAQNDGIARLDAVGETLAVEWPQTSVNPADLEFATGEVFGIARDADDGLLVSGRMLAFRIPLNDVEPFDAGLTTIAGSAMNQSGDYLARVDPEGRGGWALGHFILNEGVGSLLVTDGDYAFLDALGPDFDRSPTGPGGPLVRIPLDPPE